jgi:hypothetical protein
MMMPQASLSASEDEDVVAQLLSAIARGHLSINKGGRPLPHLCPLFLWQGRQRGIDNEDNKDNNNNLISKLLLDTTISLMLRGQAVTTMVCKVLCWLRDKEELPLSRAAITTTRIMSSM